MNTLVSKRIGKFMKPSVFEEFNQVCQKSKALNMAQGFPDWAPPGFLKKSLAEASTLDEDQYPRSGGHIPLAQAIATEFSQKFDRQIDSQVEVSVANGATGVLCNIMCAFVEDDEEVLMFEPAFEFYFKQAMIFEGHCKFLPLSPPSKEVPRWSYDFDLIEKSITNKTKIILLNSPHNPTGMMITEEDIKNFEKIAKKFPNLIFVSDEVYEHMGMDGKKHLRLAKYPGFWERTISVYSLGKTFSCTGWRIGFAIGPQHFIKPLLSSQNWLEFSVNRPAQWALANSLPLALKEYEGSATYYDWLEKAFTEKKHRLSQILHKAPFNWTIFEPEGGYFTCADVSGAIPQIPIKYFYEHGKSDNNGFTDDWKALPNPDYSPDSAFSRFLSYEYGVTPIPLSPLYNNADIKDIRDTRGGTFVRFAVCKREETLDKLESLLNKK